MAYRIRRRRSRMSGGFVASAVAAGAFLAVLSHHAAAPAAAGSVAAEAIAYARAQLGKPYLWGGTGPGAFDCSGLTLMAYAHAGVAIARTSQAQWATERHVTRPQPGDLVFFAGADGTMTSPGHVGIVTGHGGMIEAYGTGVPVRYASYDRPDLVGFTDPQGGA
jgi:cell wall-associated NlpC family hydrolase